MNLLKKHWPWLLLIFIPLWMIAVIGELMDARLLQNEGVTVEGKITSAQWFAGRRGGRHLTCNVVWNYGGREYSKEFKLPSHLGVNYADKDDNLHETRLEVLCAPSKPEVAALLIMPPDPVWVSVIMACVGLCVVSGVIWYLIHSGFWAKRTRT
jgi:hypothetical protein